MMSRISIHLKKQHKNGYDPDGTEDVETNEQKIPPLAPHPIITTGFIENTGRNDTQTHNMPATPGCGPVQGRTACVDDGRNLSPSNRASTLTAVSMQKEGMTAKDKDGTHVNPTALSPFEVMGKVESGTCKSEL
jgi:hypothetical protein